MRAFKNGVGWVGGNMLALGYCYGVGFVYSGCVTLGIGDFVLFVVYTHFRIGRGGCKE